MGKTYNKIEYFGWILFLVPLFLLFLRVSSAANISIILLIISIIIFIIQLKKHQNFSNKLGLFCSVTLLLVILAMYWFFLGMK